jgi:hypothetical protein
LRSQHVLRLWLLRPWCVSARSVGSSASLSHSSGHRTRSLNRRPKRVYPRARPVAVMPSISGRPGR